MKRLINRLKKVVYAEIENESRSLRFSLGQSSLLASRANSSNFQNLWDAEVKVYSQWGEDGILDFLCEKLQISKPKVLEIGAGNFKECNSKFLAENRNASVYLVDGRTDLISSVNRDPLIWKTHLFAVNTWVSPDNIVEIFQDASSKLNGIDILSLDIDGNDYWVLDSCPLEEVRVVVLEYNPLFGSVFQVTVPRDDKFVRREKHSSCLYYGASLRAFIELMNSRNFEFVGTNRVGNNAFFVRSAELEKIKFRPRQELSIYTDWRIRETRDLTGKLSLKSGVERVSEIGSLPLVNLQNHEEMTVAEANKI
jgi:hypothetical protein